ncbi:MAG: hypothetical protein DRJ40_06390 [Thermoprotei archaeon]|nr:MAG: hypothetical protein DRJ40_06390 [Thermoprotei archaeon]
MQFVYGFIIVEPETFIKLVDEDEGLVLYCRKKRFLRGTVYIYVSNYRGFYVITKSVEPISLPSSVDVIEVRI